MGTILDMYGEYFLATVAFCLLTGPVVHHLVWGWRGKREEVLGILGDSGIKSYFELFFPAYFEALEDPQSDSKVVFREFYDKRFGRRHFVVPCVVLAVVSAFLLFVASWAVLLKLRGETTATIQIPPIALAAFAGGYIWVLYDLLKRAHQRDMRPPHLFWAAFRLFVSAPLGYGIAAILKEQAGIPIAILLGLFPTQTLMTMGRRIVLSRLKQTDLVDELGRALEELQGIGRVQAERFRAERVSTIVQLAYSDPIDLTVRTNFSPSYVIDCCSQALAWLYFRSDLGKMGGHGLRGAQEIATLIYELDGGAQTGDPSEEEDKKRAGKCVKTLAGQLQRTDLSTFERVLREVAEDPYTQVLCEVWCAGSE
ncbi:MAG: hypothetical protein ACYS21_03525 [Planctomycetota bacterium]|jgi:hypothetical protein